MAEILVKQGTTKTWKNSGGDYAITLASVANNAARQGAKGDLGATRAAAYEVILVIETNTAPTAATAVEVYWAGSTSATTGSENPGGTDGTDSAYKAGEEDEWARQLERIGTLVMTNDGSTVQRATVGRFSPGTRWGMPVVVNKSGQTFNAGNTNHAFILVPIVDEAQ